MQRSRTGKNFVPENARCLCRAFSIATQIDLIVAAETIETERPDFRGVLETRMY